MENNESFASPKEEASKEKPDFEKMAELILPYRWSEEDDPDGMKGRWFVEDYSEGAERIWNDHVEPAKAWSEKQNAFIEKLSQENESQREQIAALQEEIRQLKNKQ